MNTEHLKTINEKIKSLEEKTEIRKEANNAKIKKLENQIEDLKRQIDAYSHAEVHTKVEKDKLKKLSSDYFEELDKTDIFGMFNIRELGNTLANLATSLIGIPFHFDIREDREIGFTCIRNYAIYFKKDIAIISNHTNTGNPTWNFVFAQAKNPTENDNIQYEMYGVGSASKMDMEEVQQLTFYNVDENSFRIKDLYRNDGADFINDFLIFVSNYRLLNDLEILDKETLKQLQEQFIKENRAKYTYYEDEIRQLKRFREELELKKQLEEQRRKIREQEIKKRQSLGLGWRIALRDKRRHY